jgi:hypothetical protein
MRELSIVAAGRNDQYDGDSLHRSRVFLYTLVALAKRHNLAAEVILVDWNPPTDRSPLYQALRVPKDVSPLSIRCITVPPELHNRIGNADKIPFFQMWAKNVGIRRASGRFIVCTNMDVVFSEELVKTLVQSKTLLRRDSFYRLDRYDLSRKKIPGGTIDEQLAFCAKHVGRVVGNPKGKRLHTDACGDFTLAHRHWWFTLRGYLELPKWSIHVDSMFLNMLDQAGVKQVKWEDPIRLYHISHDRSWSEAYSTFGMPALNYHKNVVPWVKGMREKGWQSVANNENWGLANEYLSELTHAGTPGISVVPVEAPPKAENERKTNREESIAILTMPKSFKDSNEVAIRQQNAITSWLALRPQPSVFLCGNDISKEVQTKFGAGHICDIATNKHGSLLLDSLLTIAQEQTEHNLLIYINCDIILTSNFIGAIKACADHFDNFLMIGQRTDVNFPDKLDTTKPNWEKHLRELVSARNGKLHHPCGCDYFVFTRKLYGDNLLPLAMARTTWDNYLIWLALQKNIPVVDATNVVLAIHQNHARSPRSKEGEEAKANQKMAGIAGDGYHGWVSHATYKLVNKKVPVVVAK